MIHPRVTRTSSHVSDHYDELDRAYREIWGEHVHHGYWATGGETPVEATEALIERVIDALDLQAGHAVADVGCGYGGTAGYIIARHSVAITGLTISPAQAAVAAARAPARGSFTCLVRDWLRNDLPDASFDRLYAIESSEHMADKQAFFDQAARTVKPGGRMVVCAWLADERAGRLAVDHLLEPICREGALPGMGTHADYEAMAAQAGLKLIDTQEIGQAVARTWSICGRRLMMKAATDGYYRQLLARGRNRSFALSVPRLWLALRTGAMRYGVLTWEKRS